MITKQRYGYYKSKKGIEVLTFGDSKVELPFFTFISDFLKTSDVEEDVLPFNQFLNNKTISYEEELIKINTPRFSIIQRLYACYYLILFQQDESKAIDELHELSKTIKNVKGSLIDLIDYTLDDSNPKLANLDYEDRLSECIKKSKYSEYLLSQLNKGVVFSYINDKKEVFEKISSEDPANLIQGIVMYYFRKRIKVKRCRNCNRFFIPSRLSQDYCDYIAPHYTDKTCRDIGATKNFAEKKSDDEAYQLYSKHYKRVYRYVSTGKLSKEDFQNWNNFATLGRDSVQAGKLALNKYTEKLDKLFIEVLTHTK